MKQWIAVAVVAPAMLLGVERETCPFGPFDLRAPNEQQAALYHELSVRAEAVAPSRHRATTPPQGFTYPASVNYIDGEIFGKMRQDVIPSAPIAGDEEFLRRVTLDLTGQIPDVATVQSFVADKSADKRTKMVDQLLASDAFVDRWTLWFGDLVQNVQVSSNSREFPQGRNAYYNWIHDSIKANKPYDQMVRELIGASGDNFTNGPANFWVRQIQPNGPIQDTYDNLAATSGEQFLGMPMQCLSCHSGLGHLESVNVYLKSHTRAEFWGNASFFSRGRAQRQVDPTNPNISSFLISDAANGSYALNTTSGNKSPRQPINGTQNAVSPAFFMTGEAPRAGEPWRDAYGRILTAHPQFARATVNYLWKEMFGLGIVEPANNIDPSRLDPKNLPAGQTLQPNHPNLLTLLANDFTANKYDLRAMLRTIVLSNAYQLSARFTATPWNEAWTPYFARRLPKRLLAEEVMDAVAKATSVPVTYTVSGGTGLTVTSAMKLPDTLEVRNNVYGRFMDGFGRGNRDDQPRESDTSIAQALSLMNDNTVVIARIRKSLATTTVAKTLAASSDPNVITDQLYLNTLSRYPTATEKQQAVAYLKSGTLSQKTEDLQWVLLNSVEFLFD